MKKHQRAMKVVGREYSVESVKIMCFGKHVFDSKNSARDTGTRFDQTPYKCPICHLWHLTSLSNEMGNIKRRAARI